MKALICGSFDPVTNGHLDIIRRAAALFDSVVVGIFINSEKKYYFDLNDRVILLTEAVKDLKNVTVDFSEGYVAKYVEENGIDVIVKGVRNATDFEYEAMIDKVNKQIYPGAETLLLIKSAVCGLRRRERRRKILGDEDEVGASLFSLSGTEMSASATDASGTQGKSSEPIASLAG